MGPTMGRGVWLERQIAGRPHPLPAADGDRWGGQETAPQRVLICRLLINRFESRVERGPAWGQVRSYAPRTGPPDKVRLRP